MEEVRAWAEARYPGLQLTEALLQSLAPLHRQIQSQNGPVAARPASAAAPAPAAGAQPAAEEAVVEIEDDDRPVVSQGMWGALARQVARALQAR